VGLFKLKWVFFNFFVLFCFFEVANGSSSRGPAAGGKRGRPFPQYTVPCVADLCEREAWVGLGAEEQDSSYGFYLSDDRVRGLKAA